MASDHTWVWGLSPEFVRLLSRRHNSLRSMFSTPKELAECFHTRNVVFFHPGDHESGLLADLSGFDKVVCNVGDPMTLDDAKGQTAKAERLGVLSRDFPNIVGAIVDDFSSGIKTGRMSVDTMAGTYAALKEANPALKLLAVIYTMHFDLDLTPYLPYFDVVNLWIWRSSDVPHLEEYMETARKLFPDKPIQLGLYLYDYGETHETLPMDLVKFEFERAIGYL